MQPPPQDPTNQPRRSSPYWQPNQTTPPQPLPGSTFPQNYGQEKRPGEESYYGGVPQSPSGNYPTSYYPNPNDKLGQPKRRNPMTIVVLVLLALVIILGATTVLALRHTSSSPVVAAPTATLQAGANQITSTPTATSPSATAQPVTTVASGTITKNLLLTCGANCNDPIRVTITTIQVNDANGNMIWNISMANVTGSSVSYGVSTFELLANGAKTQVPATFSQPSGTLTNSDPYSIQGIFAFVPTQNTTYKLTAVFNENGGNLGGGVTITFDPAQISF